MAMDPWTIGQSNNRATEARTAQTVQRNNQLVDQLTEPMRRYANARMDGQASLENAQMFGEQGFNASASGNPMTPQAAPRRFGSKLPGDQDFYNEFMSTIQSEGMTNPFGLAGIAATGQAESGWSPNNVYGNWQDNSASGKQGRSGFALSWRDAADGSVMRMTGLKKFAASIGDNPERPSAATQAKYVKHESPEMWEALQNAPDLETSINIMKRFWGYHDPDGAQTRARFEIANSLLGDFGGRQHSRSQIDNKLNPQAATRSGRSEQVEVMDKETGKPVTRTRVWLTTMDRSRINNDTQQRNAYQIDRSIPPREDAKGNLLVPFWFALDSDEKVGFSSTPQVVDLDEEDESDEDFVNRLAEGS